jgi:hypothetical protein
VAFRLNKTFRHKDYNGTIQYVHPYKQLKNGNFKAVVVYEWPCPIPDPTPKFDTCVEVVEDRWRHYRLTRKPNAIVRDLIQRKLARVRK